MSIDPGVPCGAVWFQTRPKPRGLGHDIIAFADYFAEGVGAEAIAIAIRRQSEQPCGVGLHRARVSIDPAGDARTAVGPTMRGEFERTGLRSRNELESWGDSKKADALQVVEAPLRSADGTVSLTIHPRCVNRIRALGS